MSDTPKKPEDGESTLGGGAPSAWKPVAGPAAGPVIIPPGTGYPGAQAYPGQGYLPPAPPLPPPPTAAAGAGGYRPVYDPGAPAGGAYGAPGYGGQQAGYPPPGYSQQGYPPPNYPPQGYGYPQNNYSQPNAADMLAAAVLIPRWRRRRRHLIFWPVFFVFVVGMVLLHGCVSLLRVF